MINTLDRYKIKFDNIICLNGKISKKINVFKKKNIIAADGAFNKLIKLGIQPQTVIGDFDSISKKLKKQYHKINYILVSSQDYNDFEKVLIYCIQNNLNNILIFGLNGGKLEHILNNISVLKKYSDSLNLYFYDKNRLAFVIDSEISVKSRFNELITIAPIPKAKLKTSNLKWELNDEYLEVGGIKDGLSNRSESNLFEIKISEGKIILFIDYNL